MENTEKIRHHRASPPHVALPPSSMLHMLMLMLPMGMNFSYLKFELKSNLDGSVVSEANGYFGGSVFGTILARVCTSNSSFPSLVVWLLFFLLSSGLTHSILPLTGWEGEECWRWHIVISSDRWHFCVCVCAFCSRLDPGAVFIFWKQTKAPHLKIDFHREHTHIQKVWWSGKSSIGLGVIVNLNIRRRREMCFRCPAEVLFKLKLFFSSHFHLTIPVPSSWQCWKLVGTSLRNSVLRSENGTYKPVRYGKQVIFSKRDEKNLSRNSFQ